MQSPNTSQTQTVNSSTNLHYHACGILISRDYCIFCETEEDSKKLSASVSAILKMIKLRKLSHPYGKGFKYVFGHGDPLTPKAEPESMYFPRFTGKVFTDISITKFGKRKDRPFDIATPLRPPKRLKIDGKTGLPVKEDEEECPTAECDISTCAMDDAISWKEWEQEKQRVTDAMEASKPRASATSAMSAMSKEIEQLDSDLAATIIEINDSIFRQNEYKAVEKKDLLDLRKVMVGTKRPDGLVTEVPRLQSIGDIVEDGLQPIVTEVNELYFERDGALHYRPL